MSANWNTEKEFVKRLAAKINISPNGGHAAVTTFDDDANLNIKFSDHTSLSSFESAVDNLSSTGGSTDIHLALTIANSQMFQVANGMRSEVA